jgi:cytochrome c biogenesis protein CcmG/thiol:disulfide interchange protein DsbE
MKRKSLIRLMTEAAVRAVRRHKVTSSAVAVFAVAVIAVSVVTTSTGTAAPKTYPAGPGFTLAALGQTGRQVSLSQYASKPVIVNFWASWCEPCQQETPLLARWYKQQDGHVVLLGLDENDNAASALRFAQAKGVTYPIGFDPKTIAASDYHVDGLPQTFFLNAQHRVVDHVLGALTEAELDKGLRLMRSAA